MSYLIEDQAAVLRVWVNFDDSESTEWCPVPEATVDVPIDCWDAADAHLHFDDVLEAALRKLDLFRCEDGKSWSNNILEWKLVGGYIGADSEYVDFVIEEGTLETKVFDILEALYADEDGDSEPDYESVCTWIAGGYVGGLNDFDRNHMNECYIARFDSERDFMNYLVDSFELCDCLRYEALEDTDLTHDYFTMGVSRGVAGFRKA